MTEVNVAVVILNYNGKHFLEKFLPIVITHSAGHSIVVADNASTDDSLAFLNQHYPAIRIIQNQGNFGYAKGYNLALKQINARYYVLLNSDVETTANWIAPIIGFMDQHPLVAACQPKILDYIHRDRFEYAGAAGGYIDTYAYPFCRGRIFNSIEEDKHQFDNAVEVFWATGACLFVRAEAFWKAGGFDDDYFAHMEEIDLCWRLKNLGYIIFVQPQSVVYHVGGGTLHKLSAKKTFLNFRNNISTLAKNHPPHFLFLKIIYRMFWDGIAAFKFLFDGQPKHFFAVIRAHFYFYIRLPQLIRKRNAFKQRPGFRYSTTQIYKGNVVIEHFLTNKTQFDQLQSGFFSEK